MSEEGKLLNRKVIFDVRYVNYTCDIDIFNSEFVIMLRIDGYASIVLDFVIFIMRSIFIKEALVIFKKLFCSLLFKFVLY